MTPEMQKGILHMILRLEFLQFCPDSWVMSLLILTKTELEKRKTSPYTKRKFKRSSGDNSPELQIFYFGKLQLTDNKAHLNLAYIESLGVGV